MDRVYPEPPEAKMVLQPETLQQLPAVSAVYFVWSGGKVAYVGGTVNLQKRLNCKTHSKIAWGESASWLEFPEQDVYYAESYYIGFIRPPRNYRTCSGRKAKAEASTPVIKSCRKTKPINRPATPRQLEVVAFIDSFISGHGFSPTIREIAAHFGLNHNAAVGHLAALRRRGIIETDLKTSRSIRLVTTKESGQ